jgi:hypothetical protein
MPRSIMIRPRRINAFTTARGAGELRGQTPPSPANRFFEGGGLARRSLDSFGVGALARQAPPDSDVTVDAWRCRLRGDRGRAARIMGGAGAIGARHGCSCRSCC